MDHVRGRGGLVQGTSNLGGGETGVKLENALDLEPMKFAHRYKCLGEALTKRGEVKDHS